MTEGRRDADSMVSGVTLLTIKGLLELIDANDASVSLRVIGLGKTYGLELLAFEDCTQYAGVHLCRQSKILSDVIDADAALCLADLYGQRSCKCQEGGITLLK
jgi:hypothetical protein